MLKWLTLSLFSHVGVVFAVDIPWLQVLHGVAIPALSDRTTIKSPSADIESCPPMLLARPYPLGATVLQLICTPWVNS